ncbi:MAG: flagellar export protein FliJ [Saccharospirillaceae bacterium]|nr:hypothetical protein A3759_04335 [Thalassolituus sp. HI0120]MCH2041580.1 flagellar export protein FliJ [Saccharospirillaceae bacterium]
MQRHPRAKRLQVIVDLTEKSEQQALAEWGKLQQKLQQEEAQKAQLDSYISEYQKGISMPSTRQLRGGSIQNALGFIGQIKQALLQQNEQLSLTRQQVDQAKKVYMEQHGKVKALCGLQDKLNAEFDAQQDKQAQRVADEWANRKAFLCHKK